MDEPIVQADVEREIVRLSALLDKATSEIAKRARDAAAKKAVVKVAMARAFLEARGQEGPGKRPPSADACEAHARVVCESQITESEMADAVLDAAKSAATNTRAQLDALRSLLASVRALV